MKPMNILKNHFVNNLFNAMDTTSYFLSLSNELYALKERVRNFINNNHPPTDGEWKESILRSMIRRNLSANIEVGRGFVVNPNIISRQIDLLFYDNTKPILFRDNDLFFLTPDATTGIIEVKSSINDITSLKRSLMKLADNSQFILESIMQNQQKSLFFCGLFIYDTILTKEHSRKILEVLKEVVDSKVSRIINHICIGKNILIKFWYYSPEDLREDYNKWYFYNLDNLSCGYFIHNVIDTFSKFSVGINQKIWFPSQGKEKNEFDKEDF